MKMNRYIYQVFMPVLLFGWSCLLTDCTDHTENDMEYPDIETGEPLRVASLTRGDGDELIEVPDPRMTDIRLMMVSQADYTQKDDGTVTYHGIDEVSGDLVWDSGPLIVKPGRDYYIFGFFPADCTEGESDVTVTDATHATLTIDGLPVVTNKDICVVTGVKAGKVTDGSVARGSFSYHAPENTSEGYEISLKADHLYASVEFRIRIDADYNKVRTVKLKSLKLKSANKNTGTNKIIQGLNVEIPLAMNDNGDQPISANPIYACVTGDNDNHPEILLYSNTGGKTLEVNNAITMTGCFAEGFTSGLYIESVYEVYDKSTTHKIEERTAKNSLASVLSGLPRGRRKIVSIKVDPTYLYILSDWDVDNPQ